MLSGFPFAKSLQVGKLPDSTKIGFFFYFGNFSCHGSQIFAFFFDSLKILMSHYKQSEQSNKKVHLHNK